MICLEIRLYGLHLYESISYLDFPEEIEWSSCKVTISELVVPIPDNYNAEI